jgi:hypothetical protein
MELDNFKILIIIIVVVIILYLIYNYNSTPQYYPYGGNGGSGGSSYGYNYPPRESMGPTMQQQMQQMAAMSQIPQQQQQNPFNQQMVPYNYNQGQGQGQMQGSPQSPQAPINSTTIIRPPVNNISITDGQNKYNDPIQNQDLFHMYDPLTYPQMRLPRDVLEQYMRYNEKNGAYPPFNVATQPYLYDNPLLVGYLIRVDEGKEHEIYDVPSIPLFQIRSVKNNNRYFYYILDQRFYGKLELKIPLDHITINGVRYNDAADYGIPELFNGDIMEHVPIYPQWKFKVQLYKTYFFP